MNVEEQWPPHGKGMVAETGRKWKKDSSCVKLFENFDKLFIQFDCSIE